RRLPRPDLVGEARRPARCRSDPDDFRHLGAPLHVPGARRAPVPRAGRTFRVPAGRQFPELLGISLAVLWIVAIMNMVNFLDGLDGLAAGVCAISGATFCVIALSLGRPEPAILAAIVLGACVGFLRHNFYPARIFMGDSGALLLGFTLGALAVQ